jgi:hypothetical protein
MMDSQNQKTDKLAQRIAERRANGALSRSEQAASTEAIPTAGNFNKIAQILLGSAISAHSDKIERAKQEISLGSNPIAIARILDEIAGTGVKKKEIAAALDKSESWVSKRLGLLKAPIAVQRLIESGELAESEYYDNRQKTLSGIKNAAGALKYQRVPTVEITTDAARALASILCLLAERNSFTSIKLEPDANKHKIGSILNVWASEILKGLK